MQRFWEYFIEKYGNEINENGFTEPLKFRSVFSEYKKLMNDSSDTPRPEIVINIDFKIRQHQYLKDKGYFVIRVGDGKFCLINEKKYGDCYLDLKTDDPIKLTPKPKNSLPDLENLLFSVDNEKTIIPKMKYYDIISQITDGLGLRTDYYDGPLIRSKYKFTAYLNNKSSTQYQEININSEIENDYTIYCDDTLILIELKNGLHLDLGWHKLAYPSISFYEAVKEKTIKKIIPMYIFQDKNDLYIYAFEHFAFYKDGIELNNPKHMKPTKFFKTTLR